MRILCLFLCSFLHYSLLAQINLENSYADGSVNRVKLANSGEKYYLLDAPNSQVKIYNSDHTLWKSINLTIPNGATVGEISLSENKVNSDNLVELVYTVRNFSTGFNEGNVVNELGVILLNVPNASALFVNEVSGLSNKIIAHISGFPATSNVYEVNSLTLENTYSGGHVERISLANSGEKYYLFASQSSQIKIYNSNHTIWKSINLAMSGSSVMQYFEISETQINSDNLVEANYSFYNNSSGSRVYEGYIVNELGTVLLSVPNAFFVAINKVPGLPNKIIAPLSGSGALTANNIYEVPTLILEHTYMGSSFHRVNLPNSGEKYCIYSSQNLQYQVYNPNHTFLKGINLPVPTGATIIDRSALSENIINSDTLLEVSYTILALSGSYTYESRIINEQGSILLSVPNASSIVVSEISTLQNKVIANIVDSTNYPLSEVYGLPTISINIQKIKASISLKTYPNPTQDYLTIHKGRFDIKEAMLVSLEGKIIQNVELSEQNTIIDLSHLQGGIYFITGEDKDGRTFCEQIKKE